MKSFFLCALAICLNIQLAANDSNKAAAIDDAARFAILRSWLDQGDEIKQLFNKDNISQPEHETGEYPIEIAVKSMVEVPIVVGHDFMGRKIEYWTYDDDQRKMLAYLISLKPEAEQCKKAANIIKGKRLMSYRYKQLMELANRG